MSHINGYFPSKFVAAADLQGQDVTVQILGIRIEEVGTEQEQRPVLYFHGMTKGMVLNRTNAKRITKLYGPETDAWVNKPITLYESETDFGGETVPCLRVRERVPGMTLAGAPQVAINGNHAPAEVAPQPQPPVQQAPPVIQQPVAGVAGQPSFQGAVSGGPIKF